MGGQPIASARPSVRSLGLGGTTNLSFGTGAGAGELPEAGVLLVVVDEFDSLDGLGDAVDLTHVVDADGGVAGLLVLLDAVLLETLHSHGECPPEVLLSRLLHDRDAHLVGHLRCVELAVGGEGGPGPVLAVPAGLLVVEALSKAPKLLRRSFNHCYDVLPARRNKDQHGQRQR